MKLANYREYLQGEFERRRVRNPAYSLRAFARDLGMSPSRLSEAINGKRGISAQLANELLQRLELNGVDAEIFRLSVEAEHSRSLKQKRLSQEKLKVVLAASEGSPKTFTIVDWVAEALLKMNERESVTENIEKVAGKLGVPSFMATKSLRFLTRLGFIKGAKNFRTYLEDRGHGRKLNVDYTQILEQALKAYVRCGTDRHFHHQAFLLEKKNLEKASQIMSRALDEVRGLESKSKNTKVVFIANQLFPVEQEGANSD